MAQKRPLSLSLTKDSLRGIDASWGDSFHDWGDGKTASTLATNHSIPQLLRTPAQDGWVPVHEQHGLFPGIKADLLHSRSPNSEVYRGIECLEEPLIDFDSLNQYHIQQAFRFISWCIHPCHHAIVSRA